MYQKAKPSNILVLLLIVLIGSFSVQCTKEKSEPYSVREISPEFKAYVAFDSSSFWIYKRENVASEILDTVKIYQVFRDRRFHSDVTTSGYYYDAIEMFYHSSLTGLTKGEIAVSTPYGNSKINDLYRIYFNNNRYFSILMPKYPFGETQLLGVNEGNFTNVALLNSLMINGRVYSEVYHTHIVDYKNAPDTAFLDFYIAKNHGLVKYTILQPGQNVNDSWVLKDFRLIPIE